jgi:hypothetical protein
VRQAIGGGHLAQLAERRRVMNELVEKHAQTDKNP